MLVFRIVLFTEHTKYLIQVVGGAQFLFKTFLFMKGEIFLCYVSRSAFTF